MVYYTDDKVWLSDGVLDCRTSMSIGKEEKGLSIGKSLCPHFLTYKMYFSIDHDGVNLIERKL